MDYNWPETPPEGGDYRQEKVGSQLPVRGCVYCGELQESNFMDHYDACSEIESVTHCVFPNGRFGVVVPDKENSRFVWSNKTGGFQCRNVSIRGHLIPLTQPKKVETVNKFNSLEDATQYSEGELEELCSNFPDTQKAKEVFKIGLKNSVETPYGGYDLGDKLVAEMLDGVYSDDAHYKEKKMRTIDERVQSVWEDIDEAFPFTYERVAAPLGYPPTQEGLRWIVITGFNDWVHHEDSYQWISWLKESEEKVALYYPNKD